MRATMSELSLLLRQITSAADSEAVTRQKLVKGHAYSLTGAVEVMSLPFNEMRPDERSRETRCHHVSR